MRTVELNYEDYLESDFSYVYVVRAFGSWQILSASDGAAFVLLLVNDAARAATVFRYDDFEERFHDVEMLRRLPPGGAAGAAVAAFLNPLPPTLSASNAKPPPENSAEEDKAGE